MTSSIDALVSEAIGEPVCRCDHSNTPMPRYSSATGLCIICGAATCRAYSTNAAASFMLRNRMRELGYLYAIRVAGSGSVSAQFWKSSADPHTADVTGCADEATELLAVAVAALAALKEKS